MADEEQDNDKPMIDLGKEEQDMSPMPNVQHGLSRPMDNSQTSESLKLLGAGQPYPMRNETDNDSK